jgi:8-oxo-dGTP pyrophosphatase MutT (NUDIX family)
VDIAVSLRFLQRRWFPLGNPYGRGISMRDTIVAGIRSFEEGGSADEVERFSDHDLNVPPKTPRKLRQAAVLVPLVEHPEGLSVLLTQRTDHLHDHAGQISFPGGRVEPQDNGVIEAALRETEEEIGLSGKFIDVVGYLDNYETVTGYLITPVVAFVTPGFSLAIDDFEVADAFEVPLDFLLNPQNHQIHMGIRRGLKRRYYVFEYQNRYIWGATAGMLMNLYRRIAALSEPHAQA